MSEPKVTRYHMCASVRGMLNWSRSETKSMMRGITKDDGSEFASVDEFRNAMMDELAKGHEVVPAGNCDNFDWKTGCKGHPVEQENQ